ncbi:AI-2E family transporter [Qipengyuania atrilutea]|uniref:AI-2E family transporter n=1 Tax=Qipengyuania atrilutea TaxID=2744473 RepID=A0A850H8H0_9SPHN|nr:AI-2E family transporter [Actirhodobacter atriluteus]NVD45555.1 AI-2E family transporter [Actirhodobacter atriluteus]
MVLSILIIGAALLAWELRSILVLAFGACLLAVLWRAAVTSLREHANIPEGFGLAITVTSVFALVAGMMFLFGSEVASQAEAIAAALPAAIDQLRATARSFGAGGIVDQQLDRLTGAFAEGGSIGGMLMTIGNGLTDFIVVVVASIFLAARPDLYRTGLIKLVPSARRDEAGATLDDMQTALSLWFKGRLVAMIGVGLLTGIGLWLIGVPSFFALGVLAGLLEIIPFFGPILAAVPGILLALLAGPTNALFATALYLAIQQAEGNLITPIIQQHAVELPPALLLFSLLVFAYLFGVLGVLLAAPLTVVFYILVKKLYVREALDTHTPIPGEDK